MRYEFKNRIRVGTRMWIIGCWSILNVKMRVGQLFETEEYYTLVENYNRYKDEHGINLETKIEDCLTIINE